MKKLSIRMTALLMALLMALSFVFVACDEQNQDDGDGDKDGNNGIIVTKNNAEEILKEACKKFKTIKALDLTVVSENNGETQTDRTLAKINEDGKMIVYAENQLGEDLFEYTYSIDSKRYENNPYMGVARYESDEELTFESLIDGVFEYIFDNDPEESVAIFCKSKFKVDKTAAGYSVNLSKVGAEEFFKAMLEEDDYKERIEPNLGTISAFEGSINFELYSDGSFKTIAFSYSATMNGADMSMGISYQFSKYDGVNIEEPAWVTEYNAGRDDDNSSENIDGDTDPENPGNEGNEGNKGDEGNDMPDDSTQNPDTPVQGGENGSLNKSDYDRLADALNEIKNADTLRFNIETDDGVGSAEIMVSVVKGSDGSYKILGEGDGFGFYINSDGVLYEHDGEEIYISTDETYGLDFVLEVYLANYGFADIEGTLDRMSNKNFVCEADDGGSEYTLESDYIEFSEITNPKLAENPGFQAMISQVKESYVEVSFTLDANGKLAELSTDMEVDLGDTDLNMEEEVEFIIINDIVEFDEPDWVANAKN